MRGRILPFSHLHAVAVNTVRPLPRALPVIIGITPEVTVLSQSITAASTNASSSVEMRSLTNQLSGFNTSQALEVSTAEYLNCYVNSLITWGTDDAVRVMSFSVTEGCHASTVHYNLSSAAVFILLILSNFFQVFRNWSTFVCVFQAPLNRAINTVTTTCAKHDCKVHFLFCSFLLKCSCFSFHSLYSTFNSRYSLDHFRRLN